VTLVGPTKTNAMPERPRSGGIDGSATVHGKFFHAGDRKAHLRGVTYGPFAPGSQGLPFPEGDQLARDLRLMAELGANCLRTFHVPPRELLDRAGEHGLRVLVTIPWAQHLTFLDRREEMGRIRDAVRAAAAGCGGHPALLGFLVGNEIPPDVVRWYGPKRIAAFLRSLRDEVKARAPGALVSYANFPSTEYLDLSDVVDFLSFNVYLHQQADLRRYLSRLQNMAGDKPLVVTELGVDSLRHGREGQAFMLGWMLRTAFECGAAGAFAFAWTDEWYAHSGGGFPVDDWAFGLVDREREKKPAFHAVQRLYQAPHLPPLARTPKASVIVCAYDAERTMEVCLDSLRRLHYPDYEVVVVDDGSRDRTLEIATRYRDRYAADPHGPRLVLVSQPNRGLSVARNVGLAASTGEVVAYTDSDCAADPDWLTHLVAKLQAGGYSAVGGPNFPPPEDALVPSAVAVAPGGPNHVLLDDEVAEHIPGCNMAFRREALQEIGGFDPIFSAAGDDVDLCWRLRDRGHVIGFSPGATVWHYRRHTVKAYLRQQAGYGKAEALLYFKHTGRFNAFGQSRWEGRIYGRLRSGGLLGRPIVYFGRFGRGPYQLAYARPESPLQHLPFTLEWNVAAALLVALSAALCPLALPLAALPLAWSLALAIHTALRARIDRRFAGPRAALLVALLTWLGPLARSHARLRGRLRGLARPEPAAQPGAAGERPRWHLLRRAFTLRYWSEAGHEKEELLSGAVESLRARGVPIAADAGWSRWDFEVRRGAWTRARLGAAAENHGGSKRLLNVRCDLRLTRVAHVALGLSGATAAGALAFHRGPLAAGAIAASAAVLAVAVRAAVSLGRLVHRAVDGAAGARAMVALDAGDDEEEPGGARRRIPA
jgi:GT2 family glycosyltransferase